MDVAARARWAPLDLARAYLDGGARLLQIRAKQLPSGPFLDLCDALVRMAAPIQRVSHRQRSRRSCRAWRAQPASTSGRRIWLRPTLGVCSGPTRSSAVSTHTVPQIEAAIREPISYLAVGPVFGTQTKDTGYSAVGLELVSTAARLAGAIPVVAIGGITLETAASVLEAGATSVAVIGDLLAHGNPQGRVAAYLQRLEQHRV